MNDDAYGKSCGCGHIITDNVQCINGSIYGHCGHSNCYGVCEWLGNCKEDENCLCTASRGDDE